MVRINQLLACVMEPPLIARTASASFAYCIGVNHLGSKVVAGFYLWNEAGDNGAHYDSLVFGNFMTLRNKGWEVQPVGYWQDEISGLLITNKKYSFNAQMEYEKLCHYKRDDRFKTIYYGCYNSGNKWCQDRREGMRNACMKHIEMGTDSLTCHPY